jgi:uncharacterized integral membrane protein
MTHAQQSPAPPLAAEPSLWSRVKLAIGLAAIALLAVFFLQNLQEVEIHFLWFDWTTRMLWALLVSAVVGALGAAAFATVRRRERERA